MKLPASALHCASKMCFDLRLYIINCGEEYTEVPNKFKI